MTKVVQDQGESLFKQIIQTTNHLERCLEDQSWQQAVTIERNRLALLQQLSSIQGVTHSPRYAAFLQQALEFIKAKQPELEAELNRARGKLSELGQQRVAASKYRDVYAA